VWPGYYPRTCADDPAVPRRRPGSLLGPYHGISSQRTILKVVLGVTCRSGGKTLSQSVPYEPVRVQPGEPSHCRYVPITSVALPHEKCHRSGVVASRELLPLAACVTIPPSPPGGAMNTKTTHAARAELADAVRRRYRSATGKQKRRILDEFVATTGYHVKSAMRVLNGEAALKCRQTRVWTCPVSVDGFLSSYLRFSLSILLAPCSLTPQRSRSFHRHDYRPPR
jgi:hypothetical protein